MESKKASLDAVDRKLLDIIQTDFPLVSRPYEKIAKMLEIEEEDVFNRITAMRENGLIRRLGANFQSKGLGWVSTLCAARVPQQKMEIFVDRVNRESGVTHNYLRDHSYNVWFTLIASSKQEITRILADITADTDVKILNMPATKMYKIKVDFPMGKNSASSD